MDNFKETQQAAIELTKLINGFQVSQIIHVAAALGIADRLRDGARPSADIAAEIGAHPRSLYRLMHALASAGVLEEHANASFSLTDMGECLRSDSPNSRIAWARNIGLPYGWQAWGNMLHSVMTGEAAFNHLYGESVWDWRGKHLEETRIFDEAMAEISRGVSTGIADAFDFSTFKRIVNVGGGIGETLAAILSRNHGCTGILYDLPHVVANALTILASHGVTDRCEVIGGDMFTAIPPGGDAYIIKNVLLDDDDERASTILKLCRSVIEPAGRVILIEPLATPPNQPEVSLLDMTMLVMTGGHKRTFEEYSALLTEAGFEIERAIAKPPPLTVLIAAPV
jgi:O-methyltransferase domain/Dimerisation domain